MHNCNHDCFEESICMFDIFVTLCREGVATKDIDNPHDMWKSSLISLSLTSPIILGRQ